VENAYEQDIALSVQNRYGFEWRLVETRLMSAVDYVRLPAFSRRLKINFVTLISKLVYKFRGRESIKKRGQVLEKGNESYW
jgi:hypothetical protein